MPSRTRAGRARKIPSVAGDGVPDQSHGDRSRSQHDHTARAPRAVRSCADESAPLFGVVLHQRQEWERWFVGRPLKKEGGAQKEGGRPKEGGRGGETARGGGVGGPRPPPRPGGG